MKNNNTVILQMEKDFLSDFEVVKKECAQIIKREEVSFTGEMLTPYHKLEDDISTNNSLNFPPFVKLQYDYLYDVMIKNGRIYDGFYQIKDIIEMIIKLPSMILLYGMSDFIITDGYGCDNDINRSSFYGKYSSKVLAFFEPVLTKSMAFGDWEQMCEILDSIDNIDNMPLDREKFDLYKAVLHTNSLVKKECNNFKDRPREKNEKVKNGRLSTYRNEKLGHGATNLDILDFFKDFKHFLKKLNDLLRKTSYIKDISFVETEKNLIIRYLKNGAHCSINIDPFVLLGKHGDELDVYMLESFNSYKKQALTLNYCNGNKKTNTDLYNKLDIVRKRLDINEISQSNMHTLIVKNNEQLDRIKRNEQNDIVNNEIFNDTLLSLLNGPSKGVFLIEAERGMGKTTFARLITNKESERLKLFNDKKPMDLSDYIVFSYICDEFYSSRTRSFTTMVTDYMHSVLIKAVVVYGEDNKSNGEDTYNTIWSKFRDSANNDIRNAKIIWENYFILLKKELESANIKQKILIIIDGVDEINHEYGSLDFVSLMKNFSLPKGVYIVFLSRTKSEWNGIERLEQIVDRFVVLKRDTCLETNTYYKTLYKYFWKYFFKRPIEKVNYSDEQCKSIVHLSDYRFSNFKVMKTIFDLSYHDYNVDNFIKDITNSKGIGVDIAELFIDKMSLLGKMYAQRLLRIMCILGNVDFSINLQELNYICFGDYSVTFKFYGLINDLDGFVMQKWLVNGRQIELNNLIWKNTFHKEKYIKIFNDIREGLISDLLSISINDTNVNESLLLYAIIDHQIILSNAEMTRKMFDLISRTVDVPNIYLQERVKHLMRKTIKEYNQRQHLYSKDIYYTALVYICNSCELTGGYSELDYYLDKVTEANIEECSDKLIVAMFNYCKGALYCHCANREFISSKRELLLRDYCIESLRFMFNAIWELSNTISKKECHVVSIDDSFNANTRYEELDSYFNESDFRNVLNNLEGKEFHSKLLYRIINSIIYTTFNNDMFDLNEKMCMLIIESLTVNNKNRDIITMSYNCLYKVYDIKRLTAADENTSVKYTNISRKMLNNAFSYIPNENSQFTMGDMITMRNMANVSSSEQAIKILSKAIDVYQYIISIKELSGKWFPRAYILRLYYDRIKQYLKSDNPDFKSVLKDIASVKDNYTILDGHFDDNWADIYKIIFAIKQLEYSLSENGKLLLSDDNNYDNGLTDHYLYLSSLCYRKYERVRDENTRYLLLNKAVKNLESYLVIDRLELAKTDPFIYADTKPYCFNKVKESISYYSNDSFNKIKIKVYNLYIDHFEQVIKLIDMYFELASEMVDIYEKDKKDKYYDEFMTIYRAGITLIEMIVSILKKECDTQSKAIYKTMLRFLCDFYFECAYHYEKKYKKQSLYLYDKLLELIDNSNKKLLDLGNVDPYYIYTDIGSHTLVQLKDFPKINNTVVLDDSLYDLFYLKTYTRKTVMGFAFPETRSIAYQDYITVRDKLKRVIDFNHGHSLSYEFDRDKGIDLLIWLIQKAVTAWISLTIDSIRTGLSVYKIPVDFHSDIEYMFDIAKKSRNRIAMQLACFNAAIESCFSERYDLAYIKLKELKRLSASSSKSRPIKTDSLYRLLLKKADNILIVLNEERYSFENIVVLAGLNEEYEKLISDKAMYEKAFRDSKRDVSMTYVKDSTSVLDRIRDLLGYNNKSSDYRHIIDFNAKETEIKNKEDNLFLHAKQILMERGIDVDNKIKMLVSCIEFVKSELSNPK